LAFLLRTFPRAAFGVAASIVLVAASVVAARAAPERAATPTGCKTQPPSGDVPLTLQSGGLTREALLYVPPSARRGHHLPLVVALHGAGGTGPKMEAYSGLDPVADRYGFAVVYPSAVPPRPFWNYTEDPAKADDVQFMSDLIVTLRARLCTDARRVYATGISNGGSMAARLACRMSDTFAAVAPVAGSYARQPACAPDRPVSLLEIHGTKDQAVPYPVVSPYMRAAAARNGCSPSPSQRVVAPRTRQFEWMGCAGGSRVAHIRVWNGVHQWPGGSPSIRSTISAQQVVWRFFSALRSPGPASP
jgi:polyhydroxybutyrate depolymerase